MCPITYVWNKCMRVKEEKSHKELPPAGVLSTYCCRWRCWNSCGMSRCDCSSDGACSPMHGSPSPPSGSSRPVHLPPSAAPPSPGLPSNSRHGNATSSVGGSLRGNLINVLYWFNLQSTNTLTNTHGDTPINTSTETPTITTNNTLTNTPTNTHLVNLCRPKLQHGGHMMKRLKCVWPPFLIAWRTFCFAKGYVTDWSVSKLTIRVVSRLTICVNSTWRYRPHLVTPLCFTKYNSTISFVFMVSIIRSESMA